MMEKVREKLEIGELVSINDEFATYTDEKIEFIKDLLTRSNFQLEETRQGGSSREPGHFCGYLGRPTRNSVAFTAKLLKK